jgi:hypothetical protein
MTTYTDDDLENLADEIKARQRRTKLLKLLDATVALALTPFSMLWQGIVISTLWAWFAEPLGLRSLPAFYAVGLVLIFRFAFPTQLVFGRGSKTYDPDKNLTAQVFFLSFFVPAVVLGLGWAWKWLGWGY